MRESGNRSINLVIAIRDLADVPDESRRSDEVKHRMRNLPVDSRSKLTQLATSFEDKFGEMSTDHPGYRDGSRQHGASA